MADIFDQIAPEQNQKTTHPPPTFQGDIFDQIYLKMKNPEEENAFQGWYKNWAEKTGLDPNPDDSRHYYDYRSAYKAGAKPQLSKEDNAYHWPSEFKSLNHPNRFVDGIDTITGKPMGDIFDQIAPEKEAPALDDPWYLKKVSLPKGIDAKAWNQGVKDIEAQGERIKNALLNPEAPYGAVETALHIGSMIVGVPAMGFGHIVDLITDGKYKVAQKIQDKLIYEPQTDSGEVIRDILFSPYTLASKIGQERSDTLFDEMAKKYSPDDLRTTLYPTIRKTLWDIIGIVASGKGMHVPSAEAPKLPEGTEAPKLDTTFAKDEIRTRMAMEKTKGVQRPLDILARKEAYLKGEIEIPEEKAAEISKIDAAEAIRQREYDQKEKELNDLFDTIPYSATNPTKESIAKRPISTNIRTLRGAIKEIGGINFLNFKGELKEMPVDVKYLSKKDGVPIDLAVNQLKDDGWLDPSTTVQSFMEDLRTRPEILREDRITRDVSEKKVHELSPQEKRFQEEMAWQPEEPPEGKYVTMRAEDLPEGKKIVLIDNKTAAGWDIYEVQEKDPFSITLVDGETIELKPLDKVQVLKEFDDVDIDKKLRADYFGSEEHRHEIKEPARQKYKQLEFEFKSPEKAPKEVVEISDLPPDSQRVRMATTGRIRTGSTKVRSTEEVASLLSHIRKSAQEHFYAVTVDKNNNIIEIHKYVKGLKGQANISPIEVAGHVLNIKDAAKTYFAHNHPTGSTFPSKEDLALINHLENILSLKDIESESIVIGGQHFQKINIEKAEPEYKIKPILRKKTIPEKERALVRHSWDRFSEKINNQYDAMRVIADKYKNKTGFLFIDAKNKDLGFMQIPIDKSTKDVASDVIAKAESLNARAMVFNSREKLEGKKARIKDFVEKIMAATKGDLDLLDIIDAGTSYMESGRMARFSLGLDRIQSLIELRSEEVLRPLKEIISDVNTILGEKGEFSLRGENLTPEQRAAYTRLSGDLEIIKRNAKRTGKTVKRYLTDLKVDPKVATLLSRKGEDLTKYAKSINFEKQDIPEDLKQFEMDVAVNSPKKVQSWDETGRLSANLRGDYKKAARVLEKAKKGEALTAIEIDAARQINVNAIDRLKEMAVKQSPEQFHKSYMNYKENVFEALSNASSEAGRALNIHKKTASVERMARAFAGLKRMLNPRELKEFNELNTEDPIEVKRFIDRLGDPSVKDYFIEYWYNQILSGIPTHLVNTVSNTGWALFQVPHRLLSAIVDMPYSKLMGRSRTRYLNETVPILAGYKSGFMRGKKAAWQTVRYNKITDFETKWAMDIGHAKDAFERSPNELLRKAAPFITWPSRMLRGMDVWANSIAYDAHARVLARRAANEKRLSGKARTTFEKKYIENLSDADHQECMKQAAYNTFMDDPDPVTEWLLSVRKKPVAGTASQFIVPFVNTISNLTKRGMEMTPGLGIVKEAVSRGMGRGQPTPEVIAKQIEGALIAMYILYKADAGDITGALPESKSEREAFYRQGKKPWGIRIGKTWYQYRRIEPFNTVIASVAIARDQIKNAKDDETATQIFLHTADGIKENLIDSSYMQGVQQIFDKNSMGKDALPHFLASWVPYSSFWRSVNRAYESATEGTAKVREGNDWLKSFSQVLPGLSGEMPAKLDLWGNEIVLPGGVFRQWLPYKWSEGTTDPVEKELERLEIYPGKPKQTIRVKGKDVKLTDEQYRDYCLDFGQNAKKKFEILLDRPSYSTHTDEQKIKMLNGRLTIARNQSLARLKRKLRERNK